jgi:Tfp pilus assembly PilM family ATPase
MDFFEHQHDATVSQVFVSGGSARSDYILQILQTELLVPCARWNPAENATLALDPARREEFEHSAPQYAVAIGAVLAAI